MFVYSQVYQVAQLRTDGVHCRESAGIWPVNLKVVPNGCCLGRSPWTNKYAPPFPTPTISMDLLLLLFLTFSVLVANPKKLLYTVANPARGLLNREKRKKKKSGSASLGTLKVPA